MAVQTISDNAQQTIEKLKLKLAEEKEKNTRITENYKKKLEIIRNHLKPEAC